MRHLLSAFLVVALSGCFSFGVTTSAPSDGILRSQRGPTFLWGIVGQQRLAPECPNGVAESLSYMPWWATFITYVTAGLVTPWRIEYQCVAAQPSPQVQAGPQGHAQQPIIIVEQ